MLDTNYTLSNEENLETLLRKKYQVGTKLSLTIHTSEVSVKALQEALIQFANGLTNQPKNGVGVLACQANYDFWVELELLEVKG